MYALDSEFIVKLYDHFETATAIYLVLEFVEGVPDSVTIGRTVQWSDSEKDGSQREGVCSHNPSAVSSAEAYAQPRHHPPRH
jgi:serine/threonine protein kinase